MLRWILFAYVAAIGIETGAGLMAVWTFAYFIPEQFRVHGDAGAALPREQVAMMLDRFLALNWIRQITLVVAFLSAVHALGLMYRSTAAAIVERTSTVLHRQTVA